MILQDAGHLWRGFEVLNGYPRSGATVFDSTEIPMRPALLFVATVVALFGVMDRDDAPSGVLIGRIRVVWRAHRSFILAARRGVLSGPKRPLQNLQRMQAVECQTAGAA